MTSEWKIINTERKPDTGLITRLTYIVNFSLEEYKFRHVGSIDLERDPTSEEFISFEELTEEILLDWVKTSIGEQKIAEIESGIKLHLEERKHNDENPEYLVGLPWQD